MSLKTFFLLRLRNPFRKRGLFRVLPLLLPALLLAGCFASGAPQRNYTVMDPDVSRAGDPVNAQLTLRLRMAPDLRAAIAPTLYRADGSVSTVPGLRYYAPLELAIPRALRELPPEALPENTLDLTILDFCVDCRTPDGAPLARVTLQRGARPPVSATEPLPEGATPAQTRAALARCLRAALTK